MSRPTSMQLGRVMTMRDPWRYRCPEGHASVRERSGRYWCETCSDPRKNGDGPWYDSVRDAKTGEKVEA